MIGNAPLDQLVASAPVNFDSAKVDWQGMRALLTDQGIDPTSIVAATWCSFGERNIEALIDSPALSLVHARGVISSVGKRKTFGSGFKFDQVLFSECNAIAPAEHTDDRGLGKYCIEFGAPGGILLGRLQWSWRAKRFRDSRQDIIAVARERDRILGVLNSLV
jgi:hypothetical protein